MGEGPRAPVAGADRPGRSRDRGRGDEGGGLAGRCDRPRRGRALLRPRPARVPLGLLLGDPAARAGGLGGAGHPARPQGVDRRADRRRGRAELPRRLGTPRGALGDRGRRLPLPPGQRLSARHPQLAARCRFLSFRRTPAGRFKLLVGEREQRRLAARPRESPVRRAAGFARAGSGGGASVATCRRGARRSRALAPRPP